MNLVRWTDDRLDDLHGTVKANDHRLDTVQDMAQTNDRAIQDMKREMDNSVTVHMNRSMLVATWASPLVTAILAVVAILLK